MANTVLPWTAYTEAVVGLNHPTLADTDNRALRQVLSRSSFGADSVFRGLPVGSSAINAGSSDYTGTAPVRITAAIADAVAAGLPYCFVPRLAWDGLALLPYNASLVTGLAAFNAIGGRVLREGGNAVYFDVKAYGAAGDGVTDDTVAIKNAITAANTSVPAGNFLAGGIVYFPAGKYIFTSTLQIPVAVNQGQVTLKGAGMRVSYLFPSGPSTNFSLDADGNRVTIIYGSLTPDTLGATAQQSFYCGWEDLSQNGALISSGSVCAHEIVELQNGWMTNAIIENFPNASLGLYLRGATQAAGLTSSYAGPHVRKCVFTNVFVTTIGSNNLTANVVILQNADENTFLNCTHGAQLLQTQAADSIKTTWIQMGRNNVFLDCLQSGERSSLKTAYDGIVFGPPQNAAGQASGAVLQNQDYGAVIEGFNVCVVFGADGSGNTHGNAVIGAHPSIYNTAYIDNVASFGIGACNQFVTWVIAPPILYIDGPLPAGGVGTLTINSTTPSVATYNVWVCANGSPTTITAFLGAVPAQPFWVRLDANTTIADSNFGGGGDIRCLGRQNIVGAADAWVSFVRVAGITYQIGAASYNSLSVDQVIPALTKTAVGGFGGNMVATQYRVANVLYKNAGLSSTSTSDASIASFSLLGRTLFNNNEAIRITLRGRQTTQVGSVNVKFGATVLGTVAPAAGANWEYEVTVTRTGPTAQLANGRTVQGTTIAILATQPGETLANPITVDFRGSVTSGGTLNVDDVTVEYLSAS